jgi:hypothetical protein
MNFSVNVKELLTLTHDFMHKGVPYSWGGKPNLSLGNPTLEFNYTHGIDCSGFVKLTLWESTDPRISLPDGSWQQHEWIKAHQPTAVPYNLATVGNAGAQKLYLCYIEPKPGVHAGHTWWVWEGWTMESHGGRGVDQRHWNTPVLVQEVAATYLIPHTWS